jgi:hypothetical protein
MAADPSWPPPVHARLRDRDGTEVVVMARHQPAGREDFIVVRETFPGGWRARPIYFEEWSDRGYAIIR